MWTLHGPSTRQRSSSWPPASWTSTSPPRPPPKLSLSKILGAAELELDDGILFGLEDFSEVVTAEDRAESARRKEQLQTQFREAAQAMFGALRTKVADLTQEDKYLQARLA